MPKGRGKTLNKKSCFGGVLGETKGKVMAKLKGWTVISGAPTSKREYSQAAKQAGAYKVKSRQVREDHEMAREMKDLYGMPCDVSEFS